MPHVGAVLWICVDWEEKEERNPIHLSNLDLETSNSLIRRGAKVPADGDSCEDSLLTQSHLCNGLVSLGVGFSLRHNFREGVSPSDALPTQ